MRVITIIDSFGAFSLDSFELPLIINTLPLVPIILKKINKWCDSTSISNMLSKKEQFLFSRPFLVCSQTSLFGRSFSRALYIASQRSGSQRSQIFNLQRNECLQRNAQTIEVLSIILNNSIRIQIKYYLWTTPENIIELSSVLTRPLISEYMIKNYSTKFVLYLYYKYSSWSWLNNLMNQI